MTSPNIAGKLAPSAPSATGGEAMRFNLGWNDNKKRPGVAARPEVQERMPRKAHLYCIAQYSSQVRNRTCEMN
jgi:hypothetical protein